MRLQKTKPSIKFHLTFGVEFDNTEIISTWDSMDEARIDMDFHYKHITRAPYFLFIEKWEVSKPLEVEMEFVASLKCSTDSKNLLKMGDQIGVHSKSGKMYKKTVSRAA